MGDLAWLAPTILALATLITSIYAAIRAGHADKNSEDTKHAVDGGLEKLLALIKTGALAEAVLAQQNTAAILKGAVAEAVAHHVAQQTPAAVPVPVQVVAGPGKDTPLVVKDAGSRRAGE